MSVYPLYIAVLRLWSIQNWDNLVHAVQCFHVMLLSLRRNCIGGDKHTTDMKRGKLVCIPVLEGEICLVISVGLREVIPTSKTYSILDDRYKDSGRGLSGGRS